MVVNTFTFDVLLACLFPIALFAASLRISGSWANFLDFFTLKFRKPSYEPFSLNRAYQSYSNYQRLATSEIASRRTTYNTLGRGHKRLGNTLGYPEKLDRLKLVTDMNAIITERIAELAAAEFNLGKPGVGSEDIGRVRESLKHFIRDWSIDGATERERIFRPIINVLRVVDKSERLGKRVLVPGSGLGRLAWEISRLGYNTTANELSFFMNLAFRFLLSPEMTTTTNEHTLRPYAHWFSHQRSNESLFRAIHFPDAIPRLSPTFHHVEADFLTLKPPSDIPPKFVWSKSDPALLEVGYDYIVTLFFIDTSLNVLATMEHIYNLLRPGGTWINLGPLLWTSGGYAKIELSLNEVIRAAEEIGFVVHDGDVTAGDLFARRTVECEYTGDTDAMMRWIYKAEFWVATKPK
ncbi:hypothetical protein H2248_007066 [Termitomyces sp. 'cryptogamus']|nr:hypothetical protein H2248_007066 [Termitomyces sp. 'cryptogamus']